MFRIAKTPNPIAAQYATSADFCRVFQKDMNRLYLLSLLLTGNQVDAEKCFVRGLSDSKGSNAVFKDWAAAWARRKVVQNAIEMIRPRANDRNSPDNVGHHNMTQPAEVAAILELPAFARFAYVLSVLEGYSLHECAILLECRRDEVNAARMRALQEIVKSVEQRDAATNINAGGPALHAAAGSDGLSHWAAA